MKPSLYFADRFRYFFKRFYSEVKLFEWFRERAGEETGNIVLPDMLKGCPKTLIFLPKDIEQSSKFLKGLSPKIIKNTRFCVHESLQATVATHQGHAFYYSDSECRYGETAFETLEEKIREYAPEICVYVGENFLPRLYLAKISGANVRIGFNSEDVYPFLNMSLRPDKSTEAALLNQYFEVQ
ncbi:MULTISPECIES: hypothetical protein [unclassified Fibrobacter]|uniref:hypothetical protein n=1 Tax=unclassified Fibrobacter TaxID=2634177 RepID=UPI000D6D572F|nr:MULTISPECIES: hypothetical protein [unclassified Fibrobacter]PWJ57282.1 hypothetical protein BGX12_1568 [Fibrobacter sp. UWR4]PZW62744.1 hypothetical protein C8E88_10568 [Fibrobacter sp. UWR1]